MSYRMMNYIMFAMHVLVSKLLHDENQERYRQFGLKDNNCASTFVGPPCDFYDY